MSPRTVRLIVIGVVLALLCAWALYRDATREPVSEGEIIFKLTRDHLPANATDVSMLGNNWYYFTLDGKRYLLYAYMHGVAITQVQQ